MGGKAKDFAAASPEEKRALLVDLLRKRAGSGRRTGPLSFAQERLWFLDRLIREKAIYNIPAAVRLAGQLNLEALKQSINEIRRRHETLRTTFSDVGGQPVQIIGPPEPLPLALKDLSGLPEAEREKEARRLVDGEAREPFDLARGPLLRIQAVRLGPEDHIVMLTMHHIISDGWSMRVLIRELVLLYNAYVNEQPSPLQDLPLQYADFALKQRARLQGDALEEHLTYWRQHLEGLPPLLKLPNDKPRPQAQRFLGATQSVALPEELTEPLRSVGRRAGTTLVTTLCACLKVLLAHWSGQDDIVVGTPVAGRQELETEGLIGFFVNTLVIRTRISGDPSFRVLLAQVREVMLEAQAHQDLPFEKLVEALQPERSMSHLPLFQVLFSCMNAERETLRLHGLTLRDFGALSGTAKLDLEMLVIETTPRIYVTLHYDTDLFEPATITRLLRHFEALLQHIVTQPDARLSQLRAMLIEVDRRQQAVEEQELTQARQQKFERVRRRNLGGST
jgi:hypothetical protein